jgi:hypothetical protein
VIIAIVVFELFVCLPLAFIIAVGSGGSGVGISPLDVWLVLAILQMTIHYLPRGRITRYGLSLLVILTLVAGAMPGKTEALTYFHQPLFIASVAVLPQLWWEWFSKGTEDQSLLWLIGLAALPLGVAAWTLANIWIVKTEAWAAASGDPYCILVSSGKLFSSGYRQAPNDWSLSGWSMVSGRGGGGSGGCCQWDFHALLLTNDKRLFNWSYRSQRFESVSERTKQSMGLGRLSCL